MIHLGVRTNQGTGGMMKYFLCLLFMTEMAFGAFQFNESEVVVNNIGRKENYLTFDSQTDVYLDFDDPVWDFGYYDIVAGTGKLVSGDLSTGYLGTFDKDDRIGIWVKGKGSKPYYYTSTDIRNLNRNTRFVGTEYEVDIDDDDDDDDPEVEIEMEIGNRLKREDGGWEIEGIEFDILAPYGGAGDGSNVNGQPLPGAFSAMVAALAAGGGLVMSDRRKKKQQFRK